MLSQSPLERALISLDGLSVGDAFGEKFFGETEKVKKLISTRTVPENRWNDGDSWQ